MGGTNQVSSKFIKGIIKKTVGRGLGEHPFTDAILVFVLGLFPYMRVNLC